MSNSKKAKMPYMVFTERRGDKWILIRMTGLRRTSTSWKLWEHAKKPNGRAIEFDSVKEAQMFAKHPEKRKQYFEGGMYATR
jgi:hypothetical protein